MICSFARVISFLYIQKEIEQGSVPVDVVVGAARNRHQRLAPGALVITRHCTGILQETKAWGNLQKRCCFISKKVLLYYTVIIPEQGMHKSFVP